MDEGFCINCGQYDYDLDNCICENCWFDIMDTGDYELQEIKSNQKEPEHNAEDMNRIWLSLNASDGA